MYHCGFIIDDCLYSYGGMTNGGRILDEFLQINLDDFSFSRIEVLNKQPPLANAKCCTVFYRCRFHEQCLSYSLLGKDVDWSLSEHYIK